MGDHLGTFCCCAAPVPSDIRKSRLKKKNTPIPVTLTKFVLKLDSLSPIHRFIGQAMSWGKYWARWYVEPNIFPTHGETNKYVYWMKNRIQFYHYYVLRTLCPISLYTFLNKFQTKEREKKYLPTTVSNIIFNLNYQIMEKEPVWELTLFLCNGTKKHRESHRERGYHLKNPPLFLTIYHS